MSVTEIIKAGVFEQECGGCRMVFRFHFADTYGTRDREGKLKTQRYVKCPSCHHGQYAVMP